MLSNSRTETLSSLSDSSDMISNNIAASVPASTALTLKDNFQRYRAYSIKLNLLADICPTGAAEQAEFDRQQSKCLKGQQAVLKICGRQPVTSEEDAVHMMKLWREEVLKGKSETQISDTDRMINQLFLYFQYSLNQS